MHHSQPSRNINYNKLDSRICRSMLMCNIYICTKDIYNIIIYRLTLCFTRVKKASVVK